MKKTAKSLDAEFFNKMYQQNEDPWDFENSAYEKEKYEATLNAIPNEVYENVFEIGCSNGVLSEKLTKIAKRLLAVDASEIAVRNATKRLERFSFVEVREMTIPENFPDEKFDLILVSEVGYFLNFQDLQIAKDRIIESLLPNGHLLLIHWTPFVEEFPLTGDEVHDFFVSSSGNDDEKPFKHLYGNQTSEYRLDLFEKKAAII